MWWDRTARAVPGALVRPDHDEALGAMWDRVEDEARARAPAARNAGMVAVSAIPSVWGLGMHSVKPGRARSAQEMMFRGLPSAVMMARRLAA